MFNFIQNYWYYPIIILIFITGLLLTVKLRGIQFRKMSQAIKLMFKKNSGAGEVSTFGALCVSLSATIGTGNIIGVATAISIGGPGALFWMSLVSIFGLATKYAEGYLAIKYRHIEKNVVSGGPFAYIEYGMGKKYKPLAKMFALFGAIASVIGIGTMTQSNGISDSFNALIGSISGNNIPYINVFGFNISIVSIIVGFIVTAIVAIVLVGGVKRITKVCEWFVPFMAIIYLVSCLLILIFNITAIPYAFVTIIKMAFNVKSAAAGVAGYTLSKALTSGVQKGIFANEAGLGSTPIALSTSKINNPVEEGLVSMAGMLITIIICLITGLVVIVTNSYNIGYEGINITNYAFQNGLCFNPIFSSILLLLCVTFFALTTIIGWHLYGVKCLNYLTKNKKIAQIYLIIYLIMVFLGSYLKIGLIWNIADIFNSLMAIPNLIALIALNKIVSKETNMEVYGTNYEN